MSGKVVIGAELQLQTAQALDNVGKVKQAFRQAQQALNAAQTEFGEFSQEALNAAKYVAQLKDKLGDAKSLVDAFNPDAKFRAFTSSINGVVGGFTALQGIMGLVGSESEDVNKALLKVQSALALSQGLNQLGEAADSFRQLGAMIRQSTVFVNANALANKAAAGAMRLFGVAVNTTSTSFKVLKGAIAATGIGLLIVGIGELVNMFDQLTSAADRAAEAQKAAFEARQRYADIGLQGEEAYIERQRQLEIAKAKNANKSEAEIFSIEQKWRVQKLESNKRYLEEVGADSEKGVEAQTRIRDLENEIQVEKLNYETEVNNKRLDERKRFAEKSAAQAQQQKEQERRQREADRAAAKGLNDDLGKETVLGGISDETQRKLKELQFEYDEKKKILQKGEEELKTLNLWYEQQRTAILIAQANERNAQETADAEARRQRELEYHIAKVDRERRFIDAHREAAMSVSQNEKLSFEERLAQITDAENILNQQIGISQEQRTQMEQNFADARVRISQLEYEHKKNMTNLIGGLMDAVSDLAGRQTGLGKGLAIASTLISTYTAAQEAYRSQMVIPEPSAPVRAAIAAAAAVVSGLARVKAIASVKVPNSGGGTSMSAPSVAGGAPLSPSVSSTLTRLDRDTINDLGNQAIKTFVVETDATTNQERVRRMNRAARFG
jgi:hypothetical protein